MKILILALGKLRGGEAEWCDEYQKRLKGSVTIKEMAATKNLPEEAAQKAEADLILGAMPSKSFVVLLDESGKDMTSRDFTGKLATWQEHSGQVTFIIGGASGVTEKVRAVAQATLSFGKLTWPHRLVRVMLLEQLYRAQQIASGHPYHRD